MFCTNGTVRAVSRRDDYFRLELQLDGKECISHTRPGHFYQLALPSRPDHVLKRPFSVLTTVPSKNALVFFIKIVGEGTALLSEYRPGQSLPVVGPLGNTFPQEEDTSTIWVGGGTGIAPVIFGCLMAGGKGTAFFGIKTSSHIEPIAEDMDLLTAVTVVTEDSTGDVQGMVTAPLDAYLQEHSGERFIINACGPLPMLKTVKKISQTYAVPAYFSMEAYMGCGVGICSSCACETIDGSYALVCRDGPIFPAERLTLSC